MQPTRVLGRVARVEGERAEVALLDKEVPLLLGGRHVEEGGQGVRKVLLQGGVAERWQGWLVAGSRSRP